MAFNGGMTAATEPAPPRPPLSAERDRRLAARVHLANLFSVVPAAILWAVHRRRGAVVDDEGREAVDWGTNVAAVLIADAILQAVAAGIPIVGSYLRLVLALVACAVLALNAVVAVSGWMRVRAGGRYRAPFIVRWVP